MRKQERLRLVLGFCENGDRRIPGRVLLDQGYQDRHSIIRRRDAIGIGEDKRSFRGSGSADFKNE